MMKKYELPKIKISVFDSENIVTVSGKLNDFNGAKSTGKVDIMTFISK